MAKTPKNAISPTREDDFPEWYQPAITRRRYGRKLGGARLHGDQAVGLRHLGKHAAQLDRMFKETGHQNAYFPLFIPLSYLEKEAAHVEGFAKECAVVTHHRLEAGADGKLVPTGKLEEPLVVRPDLRDDHRRDLCQVDAIVSRSADSDQPMGQRGALGDAHAAVSAHDGIPLARRAHGPCDGGRGRRGNAAACSRSTLLSPKTTWRCRSCAGEKTASERFPGAMNTYSIEAMMQDRKAVQAGTSHFLGQNFSQARKSNSSISGRERNFRLDHVLGRFHAAGRGAGHDARRRRRLDFSTAPGAAACRDLADLSQRRREGGRDGILPAHRARSFRPRTTTVIRCE